MSVSQCETMFRIAVLTTTDYTPWALNVNRENRLFAASEQEKTEKISGRIPPSH